jgi:hypothetical protein
MAGLNAFCMTLDPKSLQRLAPETSDPLNRRKMQCNSDVMYDERQVSHDTTGGAKTERPGLVK